jgi:hypothetical protein
MEIECETLWLPSDWSEEERLAFGMAELAECERLLREAEVHEYLNAVRGSVKVMGALSNHKKVHARGQGQNTWALSSIKEEEKKRDLAMRHYNSIREALLRLVPSEERPAAQERMPVLSVQDTYRKPPQMRREVGDSRRSDGRTWDVPKSGKTTSSREDGWIWRTSHIGKMTDAEYEEWELAGT